MRLVEEQRDLRHRSHPQRGDGFQFPAGQRRIESHRPLLQHAERQRDDRAIGFVGFRLGRDRDRSARPAQKLHLRPKLDSQAARWLLKPAGRPASLALRLAGRITSYVARELVKLGGHPAWRMGFTTDNGNVILDVSGMSIVDPVALEAKINQLAGVVTVGLFARRGADIILLGTDAGVRLVDPRQR